MINNRPFINLVMQVGHFKNHSQMADELKISRVSISRIYHNTQNVSAETILAVHEYLGIPVYEIREVLQSNKTAEISEDLIAKLADDVEIELAFNVYKVSTNIQNRAKAIFEVLKKFQQVQS
jgi:transcriptional regulator with XRE-family HTH domain